MNCNYLAQNCLWYEIVGVKFWITEEIFSFKIYTWKFLSYNYFTNTEQSYYKINYIFIQDRRKFYCSK